MCKYELRTSRPLKVILTDRKCQCQCQRKFIYKRKTSNVLYALVRSGHKRFQMLSEFVSANIRIAQVVWQRQSRPKSQTTPLHGWSKS